MATGTVKWFSDEKGYGFIAGEDGKNLFVHYTGIADGGFRTLPEGASRRSARGAAALPPREATPPRTRRWSLRQPLVGPGSLAR